MAQTTTFPLRPPIDRNALKRLRLALRKHSPSSGLGAHLHRRMGQSLEFREYRDYTFGDDIRTVDWSASARRGHKWDLVAKSFEAEERRTLVLILDCRLAMRLPEAVPKLLIATWIAGCLAEAAFAEKDRVVFAPAFAGRQMRAPFTLHGLAGLSEFRGYVEGLLQSEPSASEWNEIPNAGLAGLQKHLRPAAAVVMITDALFADPGAEFSSIARLAQKSFRTFHVVEIDSWPYEKALLQERPFRLKSMAGREFDDKLSDATGDFLSSAKTQIEHRRSELRKSCAGPGLIWPRISMQYPPSASFDLAAAETWFQYDFPTAPFLSNLLSRAA